MAFYPRLFIGRRLDKGACLDLIKAKYGSQGEIDHFSYITASGLTRIEQAFLKESLKQSLGNGRVLCLGCGAGRDVFPLTDMGFRVSGIDISEGMIRSAMNMGRNSNGMAQFLVGEAGELPFKSESHDVVLMLSHFINHFHGRENRIRVFREVARVMKGDGRLILSMHNKALGISFRFLLNFIYRRIKRAYPEDIIEGNGLPPVYSRRMIRTFLHTIYLKALVLSVNTWRNLMGFLLGRYYKGREPGDFLVPAVSDAATPGPCPYHLTSIKEINKELNQAGLKVLMERDAKELQSGVIFPKWIRRGSRVLFLSTEKDFKGFENIS